MTESASPIKTLPATAAEAPKATTAAEIARATRRERARKLTRNLAFWVGLPTLVAAIYFGFIARNEYESVSTLVFNGSSEVVDRDATILREYAMSRDMLRALDKSVSFSERYQQGGDLVSRLAPNAGSETRYAFFRRHVDAQYDSHSRVFTLRVRAFSGGRAQEFSRQILESGRIFLSRIRAQEESFIVVSAPSAPNEATHPRRGYAILTALFASLALFGVGSLLIAAVREHGRF